MIDSVYRVLFSPWLSQEKINLAIDCKRENTIFCKYLDHKSDRERTGLLNEKTGEVLWADRRPIVGMKMFGVALAVTPITTLYYSGMMALKTPYSIAKLFFTHIQNFAQSMGDLDFKKAFYDDLLLGLLVGLVETVFQKAFVFVRILWNTIAMEMAAILAFTITPDIGKRLYSLLETERNGGGKRECVPKDFQEGLKYCFENEVLWLAPCPHPWCHIDDTYVNQDKETVRRYSIVSKSSLLTDYNDTEKCNDTGYAVFPLVPCFNG